MSITVPMSSSIADVADLRSVSTSHIVYSMQIQQPNISEAVSSAIHELIVDGSLADGARINEVHLAKQLGVSRTPLREALCHLQAEGLVTQAARRGFFVPPMTCDEFQQLYTVRPLLDPEALRLGGCPDASTVAELERLNTKLLNARSASRAIDIDNAWHRLLLEGCPNRVLLEFIEQIMTRTRRYEHALFRETQHVWVASDEHTQIIAALKKNDLRAAVGLLRQNMQTGHEVILNWLQQR
ncbi:MAG: GntR family transcriptional regulator [Pseudomonadota bacterium]